MCIRDRIVDAENKTLTVQSEQAQGDMVYDLTDKEVSALISNALEEHSIEKRLEVLNGIVEADFADKITQDTLNSCLLYTSVPIEFR